MMSLPPLVITTMPNRSGGSTGSFSTCHFMCWSEVVPDWARLVFTSPGITADNDIPRMSVEFVGRVRKEPVEVALARRGAVAFRDAVAQPEQERRAARPGSLEVGARNRRPGRPAADGTAQVEEVERERAEQEDGPKPNPQAQPAAFFALERRTGQGGCRGRLHGLDLNSIGPQHREAADDNYA